MMISTRQLRVTTILLAAVVGTTTAFVSPGFASVTRPAFSNGLVVPVAPAPSAAATTSTVQTSTRKSTQLYNFLGSDGGILGVGTPEIFIILLVGYFVLGPSDLYKLVKEVGKQLQSFRSFATEATSTLENNFESQLQLEEIRKAQQELTDAFSFRRSINVDGDTNPFEVNVNTPRAPDVEPEFATGTTAAAATAAASANAAAATATTADGEGAPKKKIRRRRVKKTPVVVEEVSPAVGDEYTVPVSAKATDPFMTDQVNLNQGQFANDVPDLTMTDEEAAAASKLDASGSRAMNALEEANEELRLEAMAEEEEERRTARMQRLQNGQPQGGEDDLAQQELASTGGYDLGDSDQASRFQSQMSGNWNDQILSKDAELMPLAQVMERLAILEDEKNSADSRLQEEFRLREENEQQYYKEKRKLLEEAAAKIQAEAYAGMGPTANTDTTATK